MSDTTAATSLRTHRAGSLRRSDVGATVRLGGWVHRTRDLGGLVFIDLRDRDGLVQVSVNPEHASAAVLVTATTLGAETVVLVEGVVVERPETMRNSDMSTGDVEVRATSIKVVGPAVVPVIPVARGKNESLPSEELRLRHRYLDLRRPELQQSIILKHRLMQTTRRHLSDAGYLEIETPILTKPTPATGARDYLVPSRVHAGEFYALPQSPQLYKQLLMVAGFDRYFQIARCFRDEDLRVDRQPEFTQIDIEASFITADDILGLSERLMSALWAEAGLKVSAPFRRMSHAEAIEKYGTDKPDLRYGLEIFDASAVFRDSEFAMMKSALERGDRVRGIRVPGGATLSRKQLDEIEAIAKSAGAGGLLRLKMANGQLEGPAAKHLVPGAAEKWQMRDGDLIVFVAAPSHIANPALDKVRQDVAKRLDLVRDTEHVFLIVNEFPMFEKDPASGALMAVHHPFTAPMAEDVPLLDSAPEKARAQAYDVVYNGNELGGGSIRISDPGLQSRVFKLLGIDDKTAELRFGFLLEGLRAGAPPHGGVAFGLDRIAMQLAGAQSLRDVIAFPKTTAARALYEGAPAPVPSDDLKDLHIRIEGRS
jgi:aspartyl-tRNA synthetase